MWDGAPVPRGRIQRHSGNHPETRLHSSPALSTRSPLAPTRRRRAAVVTQSDLGDDFPQLSMHFAPLAQADVGEKFLAAQLAQLATRQVPLAVVEVVPELDVAD